MKREMLKPTNDYVFKRLFGKVGNENITKKLLESITHEKYTQIELDSTPILEQDLLNDKIGILDIKVKTETEEIDIEMQVAKQEQIIDRMLWYTSGMYYKSIKKGELYSKTKRVVGIVFVQHTIKGLENEGLHSVYNFSSRKTHTILTKKEELHIIQIDKLGSEKELEELSNWVKFLIAPESVEESIMEKYEGIKKAKEELDKISQDEIEIRRAEMRDEAIRNTASYYDSGYKKGREAGMEEGIKEGSVNQTKKIAKSMKEKGIDIATIFEITGLSKEQIEKL